MSVGSIVVQQPVLLQVGVITEAEGFWACTTAVIPHRASGIVSPASLYPRDGVAVLASGLAVRCWILATQLGKALPPEGSRNPARIRQTLVWPAHRGLGSLGSVPPALPTGVDSEAAPAGFVLQLDRKLALIVRLPETQPLPTNKPMQGLNAPGLAGCWIGWSA